jgi:transcriptional regulator with XRE-family HTH domain
VRKRDPVDSQLVTISERVRRWREAAGLTLQDLARRSELATSTVQKVETGQMIPSVAVLLKLANGLGRRAAEFVQESGGELEALHLRRDERSEIGVRGRMTVERLSADLVDSALEMWRVELAPGVSSGSRSGGWEGEALVVCEAGSVAFLLEDRRYDLEPGDSLHFKATIPHQWRNDGSAPARFTLTGTRPRQLRALIQGRIASAGARQAS